jgi:hypothetical protein
MKKKKKNYHVVAAPYELQAMIDAATAAEHERTLPLATAQAVEWLVAYHPERLEAFLAGRSPGEIAQIRNHINRERGHNRHE